MRGAVARERAESRMTTTRTLTCVFLGLDVSLIGVF